MMIKRNKKLLNIMLLFKGIFKSLLNYKNYVLFCYYSRTHPIVENKIIMSSYDHKKISCNPKYVTKYIIQHLPVNSFEIVWILDNDDFGEFKNSPDIRFIKSNSSDFIREMSSSKFILYNKRTNFKVPKRKGQKYIQLWHSSARLKKIEGDAASHLSSHYIREAKKDSNKIDLMLSGSQHSTDIFQRAFWYHGEILNVGTPRNDIFFNNNIELVKTIKERLGVSPDTKICLYAPTFRSKYMYNYFDILKEDLIHSLSEKFGDNWKLLIRLHPNLSKHKVNIDNNNILDVSSYHDIQEILYVSDIVISDYSSLIFDFCITKRPVFLFVPDLEEYYQFERDLYFKLEELPFTMAKSFGELKTLITNFDYEEYQKKLEQFISDLGSFEEGRASQKVVEYMLEHIKSK